MRLPCLTPRVCSNSFPLSQWCHPTISSSVAHFSCPQSFPASQSFPMSWLFALGGKSFGASAAVFLMNIQGLFSLGLTGLIFLQSKGLSRALSSTTVQKHHSLMLRLLHGPALTSFMTTGKTIALTVWTFVDKVMSLFFNTLPRFFIASKEKASFNFLSLVTFCSDFGAQQNKVCYCFHFFPIYLPWVDGIECHDLSFLNDEFEVGSFILFFHLHQETL